MNCAADQVQTAMSKVASLRNLRTQIIVAILSDSRECATNEDATKDVCQIAQQICHLAM
jgi:hypothetical protein